MKEAVRKIFFGFLCVYLQLQLIKTVIFRLDLHYLYIKKFLKQTWKSFNTNFWPQSKNWKSSYKVRQIFTLSWYLIALILDQNYVKSLRVTNIVKEIKFERAWRELEAKKMFPEKTIHKLFETNSSFHVE